MRSRRVGNAPRRNVGKRTAYRRVAHPTTVDFSGINPSTFAISSPNLYLSQTANEVTMLRDDINSALKDAMKAKDERRGSTPRLVHSTPKNAHIAERGHGKGPPRRGSGLGGAQKLIHHRPQPV